MFASLLPLLFGLFLNEPVVIEIDAKPSHPISPGIYGASAVSPELARKYGLATVRWAGLAGTQRFAFQLYRNPDGKSNGFGSKYIPTRSSDPTRVTAYTAQRDDASTTIVLINKDLKSPVEVSVPRPANLARSPRLSGRLYRLPNPPEPVTRETWGTSARVLTVTLQPLTACLIDFPPPP